MNMRLRNTGNCLHRVAQHIRYQASQQVAVGPKLHVYRYGIIYDVGSETVVCLIDSE